MVDNPAVDISITKFEIAKLSICAGDVLVVRTPNARQALSSGLGAYFQYCVPEGVKIMLIDESIELAILTAREIADRVAVGAEPKRDLRW